jgi:Holliday junction resolvase RusA-like endonuclease
VIISFTILGAPRTKKNSGWRTKAGHQMPSHAYLEWDRSAQWMLALVRRELGQPIGEPINCAALFYREAAIGDAVGYYQALADTLQKARIVVDDRLIVSWDGSRMRKDSKQPRVEVTLSLATELEA